MFTSQTLGSGDSGSGLSWEVQKARGGLWVLRLELLHQPEATWARGVEDPDVETEAERGTAARCKMERPFWENILPSAETVKYGTGLCFLHFIEDNHQKQNWPCV